MDNEEKIQKEPKKLGRPKKERSEDIAVVDEDTQERLDMEHRGHISIQDITDRWDRTFYNIAELNGVSGIGTVAEKWNKLNPFLQNQRIKNLYTSARAYSKIDISEFLKHPGNNEQQLRSLQWANSSSQQIYYNLLRKSCDIPVYNYYVVPDYSEIEYYNKEDYKTEQALVQNWLEIFNIQNTLKTIALEVKREGKCAYLLRNKFLGNGKMKTTSFATLQKMPTDWIKITGKGKLGYTISFNMMYFLDIANSPEDFGEFMVNAYKSLSEQGIVNSQNKGINMQKAIGYKFSYNNQEYNVSIETKSSGSQVTYLLWLRLPYDMCYVIGSDNSHPWMTPDTMGLMLKLQELTDYGQLAGLIASTPLTAVLTGEIETIQQPRAGKNESVFSPEVIQGMMDRFNAVTSTNIEAWMWPAKNIKLQQLDPDVNSSDIINTATENFIDSAGEGGLTVLDSKPNVAQVKTAQLLAASKQHYVTLQMENILNFILQNKLGFKYTWKIKIWGDIFSLESEKKYLKEVVASGNIALLPKLMSAEGLSMNDTKAIVEFIKQLDFYKDFKTYTQEYSFDNSEKIKEKQEETSSQVGRPALSDSEIENDATAASRESGNNNSDNRY